ncbi:MAG: DMT family transporter, partial [Clostridia bacterium]|nr:DMT family transporter [Clostridia bacterium]
FGGIFLKNDSLTVKKICGCVLGLAGIIAVSTDGLTLSFSPDGEGMMTLSAITQTAAYFVAVKSSEKLSAIKLVGYGQFLGGEMLIVFSLFAGGRVSSVNPLGITVFTSLALISAVAYVLSLMPLKYFPASEIAVFNLLITVFGVVMSALVLGENIFRLNYALSLVLVSAGIFLVNHGGKNDGNI